MTAASRQQAVEKFPAVAQLLLVDTDVQDIVEEDVLRHILGQGGLLPQEDAMLRTGEEDGKVVIGPIAQGAVGIDPFHRQQYILRLLRRGKAAADFRRLRLPGPLQQGIKLRLGSLNNMF